MQHASWRDRIVFAVPTLILLISILLALSPPPFDGLPPYPHSYLLFICVFTIYAPQCLPIWVAFLAGLLADIIYATPLGAHGICAVLLQYALLQLRDGLARAPFVFVWGVMALLITIYLLVMWGIGRWVAQQSVPLLTIAPIWLMSLVCYPLWHSIGLRILRLLPSR